MQPGRPSSASLNIVPIDATKARLKLIPLSPLSKGELKLFQHAVHHNRHLRAADIPQLELYSMSYCRAVAAHKRKDTEAWQCEIRIVLAIARSLRLTVQSAQEPKTVGRKREAPLPSFYELMGAQDDRS